MNEFIIQLESLNELSHTEKEDLTKLMGYYLNRDQDVEEHIGIENYRIIDERKLYKLLGDVINQTEEFLKENGVDKMEMLKETPIIMV